jgi:4-amino-4-deoxy-L-arabinose transferase-like glycosyltransferase
LNRKDIALFRKLENTPSSITGAVVKGSASLVALAALLAVHALFNAWWLGHDNHVHWLDEQVHLEQARAFYEALFQSPGTGLLGRIAAAFAIEPGNPAHPPLLYLCGALAQGILGYGTDQATLVNTAAFLLLIVAVYRIAREFLPRSGALFAATVASLTPGLAVASRYFMTDYLAACLVAWAVYALLRSRGFHNLRWTAAFGALNALALLTRTVTPVYYLVPLLMVLVYGFLRCLGRVVTKDPQCQGLAQWTSHLVLVALLAGAIAAPWYVHHRGAFFNYWMVHRGSEMPPFAFAKPLPKTAETAAAPAKPATPVTGKVTAPAPSAPATATVPVKPSVGAAHTPWIRYPVFVINNGLFLLPFVLCCLGLVMALLVVPRSGWFACFMLAGWALGAWALFTVLFRFGTPRYAVPLLAPLAVFAALPALAVANVRLRRAACGACLAVMAVPYASLTFQAIPGLSELRLPARPDPSMLRAYDEKGLYLCKDRLTMGNAYSWLGAPVAEADNYQDRMFFALLRAELARNRAADQYAPYAVVNLRGFGFQDRHFWPEPNPFRRHDLPADLAGVKSRITKAAQAWKIEEIEPYLAGIDYVIFALEEEHAGAEESWRQWLSAKGLQELDRFAEPRRATIPAYLFGVWGRPAPPPVEKVATPGQVDAMGVVPLLRAMNTADAFAAPELLRAAQLRLTALLAEADKTAAPLNSAVALTAFDAAQRPDGVWELQFIFRVLAPIDRDYTVALRGVGPQDVFFRPVPPTREWAPGTYMLVTHETRLDTLPAQIQVGLAAENAASQWVPTPWPKH